MGLLVIAATYTKYYTLPMRLPCACVIHMRPQLLRLSHSIHSQGTLALPLIFIDAERAVSNVLRRRPPQQSWCCASSVLRLSPSSAPLPAASESPYQQSFTQSHAHSEIMGLSPEFITQSPWVEYEQPTRLFIFAPWSSQLTDRFTYRLAVG